MFLGDICRCPPLDWTGITLLNHNLVFAPRNSRASLWLSGHASSHIWDNQSSVTQLLFLQWSENLPTGYASVATDGVTATTTSGAPDLLDLIARSASQCFRGTENGVRPPPPFVKCRALPPSEGAAAMGAPPLLGCDSALAGQWHRDSCRWHQCCRFQMSFITPPRSGSSPNVGSVSVASQAPLQQPAACAGTFFVEMVPAGHSKVHRHCCLPPNTVSSLWKWFHGLQLMLHVAGVFRATLLPP